MDGQLILGIIVAVVGFIGSMFWFGHRLGVMSSESVAQTKIQEGLRTDLEALRVTVNLMGVIVSGVKTVEDDVKLIKDSLFRRAQAELASKGWGGFASPFHIGQVGVDAILPFITEFVPFYCNTKKEHPEMSDQEFFWLLEKNFGDVIIEKICAPQQLSQLGCLIAILEVCKLEGAKHA